MTTTTVPTVAERVQAGAAWLDENEPGWVDRIDLDTFNMPDCHRCVLGQLWGNYFRYPDHELTAWRNIQLGFQPGLESYDEMTEAWRELIASRLAGGGA